MLRGGSVQLSRPEAYLIIDTKTPSTVSRAGCIAQRLIRFTVHTPPQTQPIKLAIVPHHLFPSKRPDVYLALPLLRTV